MRSKSLPIAADALRARLSYDPEFGLLVWLDGHWKGKEAFACADAGGYLRGNWEGKTYSQHRIIWAVHYGQWPTDEIDHINGVRSDNRISNLRQADRKANTWNRKQATASSGELGVTWNGKSGKWTARITRNGELCNLGLFETIKAARAARVGAASYFEVARQMEEA